MRPDSTLCERLCPQCGKSFSIPTPKHRKQFCSHACRGLAFRKPAEERFWAQVDKSGECWLWTGHRLRRGYGQFSLTWDHPVKAHRFSFEAANGPIPEGMMVLHNCPGGDNPACVNPAHLFLGTHEDNMADMKKKGRAATGERNTSRLHPEKRQRGEANPHAKLTEENVREIRRLAGSMTLKALAAKFGVSFGLIGHVVHRRVWRHI